MEGLIARKHRQAKASLIFVLTTSALWVVSLLPIPELAKSDRVTFILLSTYLMIPGMIVLFARYLPLKRALKSIAEMGMDHSDIDPEAYSLPHCKISCGSQGFYCKKPFALIPYDQILWIYLHRQSINGIPAGTSLKLRTREGKEYTLPHRDSESKLLLEKYILPHAPDIILGYGAEQKHLYELRRD